jgi:hypothetical protein
LAERIAATVYVAGATDDDSFTTEQAGILQSALTGSGVDHTLEFYPARHGFAVPDNPGGNDYPGDGVRWDWLHAEWKVSLSDFHAALIHSACCLLWSPTNLVIQTSAARATTVIGSPSTNPFGGITGTSFT